MIVYALVAHLQNLTLSIWQCWSPRYVSVLSTYGGYHPSGLIVASLHKPKRISIITIIIDLSIYVISICITFTYQCKF